MPHSLTQNQIAQIQECLLLAQNPRQHDTANQKFAQLLASVETTPATVELLQRLWHEILSARRSATFWEQISDAEKEMSDRLAQNHVRLQQNYLRLMQEQ
jgi:hypothetical protein